MSLIEGRLYRINVTPWDTGEVPGEPSELVAGAVALPPGRAPDVGCGTGTQSA